MKKKAIKKKALSKRYGGYRVEKDEDIPDSFEDISRPIDCRLADAFDLVDQDDKVERCEHFGLAAFPRKPRGDLR